MTSYPGSTLIPIGTFSSVTQMTQKTLRFYAEQGILAPAWVAPGNGYRYYRPDQITKARRIQMLREIGMSLSEVNAVNKAYEQSPQAASQLVHRHFMNRQAEFQSECETYRFLVLGLLDDQSFEETRARPVSVREEAGGPVLAIEACGSMEDLGHTIANASKALFEATAFAGGVQRAAPFVRHFHAPEPGRGENIQVCLPLQAAFPPPAGFRIWHDRPHKEAWTLVQASELAYPNYLVWVESLVEWLVRNNKIFIGFAMRSIIGQEAPIEFAWPFDDTEDEEGDLARNQEQS